MAGLLNKYRLFLAVMAVNLGLTLWDPLRADLSLTNSRGFVVEILLILPPVMVLMGLLDAWVPRQMVEAHLGRDAGWRGAGIAMLLGTTAAGPLYAAFPIALALGNKGARLANVVIFLGTWAAIKLPMLIIESSFLGLRFALLRLALTVPCVLAVGYLIERILPAGTVTETANQVQEMEATP